MDKMQFGNGKNEDSKTKLWTYLSVGLILGALFLIGKRHIQKRKEKANEESVAATDMSLPEIKIQLDRIEKSVNKIKFDAVRLWILAVGIAAIFASPTIIPHDPRTALLMFLLGVGLILFVALFKRK
jgi:Flp pilus assembly protein TadB